MFTIKTRLNILLVISYYNRGKINVDQKKRKKLIRNIEKIYKTWKIRNI